MWPAAGCRAVPALSWSLASDWSDPGILASDWLSGGVRAQLITGQSPALCLALLSSSWASQVSPVSIWAAGKWPALPCPAPWARPGTRRGTQGSSRPAGAEENTVIKKQKRAKQIVAYFLLHSELRLRSRESGTECSIETGMDSQDPVTSHHPHSQVTKELSKVVPAW